MKPAVNISAINAIIPIVIKMCQVSISIFLMLIDFSLHSVA